ncbi:hypothetical protein QFZ48_004562 [Chitinophaga sp. W2I13]|uniref:toll/interleukin-1 receptor domain-containing protein n=1 Tax=Chitinophaga sp. W2I13 TaxID=3373923 RepID=UPI003D21F69B
MATLLEYFNNDFPRTLAIGQSYTLKDPISGEETNINLQLRVELQTAIRFLTYYLQPNSDPTSIIYTLTTSVNETVSETNFLHAFTSSIGDITIGNKSPTFSNKIYFYYEGDFPIEGLTFLDELSKKSNLNITIRDQKYLQSKMKLESPIAFISHDSRDKDIIARPLAHSLNSRLCFVWYDEFTLKVGDSLRGSIEKGIKEAKKCILILTKNFLTNSGWTKTEFDAIFTRELIFNQKIILPIWYNITVEEVYDYSPSLADCFGLTWPSKENKTEEQYQQEIEALVSKIHTAITV